MRSFSTRQSGVNGYFCLLILVLLSSGAYAQFGNLPLDLEIVGTVGANEQRFYKFPVTKGVYYYVEMRPMDPRDQDVYGHYKNTVSYTLGMNNQGASRRSGNQAEHFSFHSNYDGEYFLAVHGVQAGSFALKVRKTSVPTVITTYPNSAGIVWNVGETKTITWSKNGDFDKFLLEISRNGGVNSEFIDNDEPGTTSSYSWTVTGPASTDCRIRVQGLNYNIYSEKDSPYPYTKPWVYPDHWSGLANFTIRSNVAVEYIRIEGLANVAEETPGTPYSCIAHYTDNTEVTLTSGVTWSVISGPATINTSSGVLTTPQVTGDTPCRIQAIYQDKSDTHDVMIVDVPPGTPGIGHTPEALSPACVQGQNPAEQTLFVWNSAAGGGILKFVVAADVPWITLSPTAETSSGSMKAIKVNYFVSTLAAGQYTGNITISAPTQPAVAPKVVPVTLTISATTSPVIGRTPASLSTGCEQNQNPANQSFEIWNAGGGTLNFTITETADWIASVSPVSGALTGSTHQTVTVTYAAAGKTPGTYSTQISIADPAANPAAQTVTVTLTVTQPAAPPPPTLNQPGPDKDVVEPDHRFSWYPVSGATGYKLWVARNGTDVVHNEEHPSTTLSVPVILPSFGKYVWKVCAKNGTDNWGAWSSPRTAYYRVPEKDPICQQNQPETHDPVNTYSGAYRYSREDLSLPGRGLPFEFARFYSSKAAGTTVMGARWRHTYLVELVETEANGPVVIHWANWSEDYFTPAGEGQYENTYFGFSGRLRKNPDGTFDFRTKVLVTYHFDGGGVLQTIEDRNGNRLTLNYAAGVLDSVTDTVGRVIDFQYDGNGKLWKVVDPLLPANRQLTFEYTNDDLTSFTDMRGYGMAYEYEDHNLTHIQDRRNGTLVTNVYDENGRAISQTNGRDNTWSMTYTPAGITTETNPLSGNTVYEYNDLSWLAKRTDPNGHFEQYAYDENGNRTEALNARGYKTAYTYDSHGNVLSVMDALSNKTTFEYNENDQVTLITDPLLRETRFTYDSMGNLASISKPLGHVTTFEYDVYGQVVRTLDAMGRETLYAYDDQGNRVSTTNPLGQTVQNVYDNVGRLVKTIEPNGAETEFAYDEEDNLKTVTDQEDHVTEYTYDENGNRKLLRNPRLFETEFNYNQNNLVEQVLDAYDEDVIYGYDALDRLTSLTDRRDQVFTYEYDPVGNRIKSIDAYTKETRSTYDANGNVVSMVNANNHSTTFAYDELERLVRVTDALGDSTENTYDEVGRLIAMKDGNENTTTYTYDDLDRLIRVEDPELGTAEYAYDLNGNRIAITDPNGHTTCFEYDVLNRVVLEVDALGRKIQYTYDDAGNLLTRKDARGYTTTYAYYPTHRLQTVTYPGGTTVSFTYDANGNRIQMVDAQGTTLWEYDPLDRITSVTDPFGKVVGYDYDANSNRRAIDYDGLNPGTKKVNYTFDNNGRLASLTDWAGHTFTYHYDDAGNMIQLDYPNGCKEKRTHYNNERLKTLVHEKPDATEMVAYAYYYDGAGNITGMDRKEAVEREFQAELTNYSYNADNEIRTAGTISFQFDANGNQVRENAADGVTQFGYDFENRLVSLDPPDSDPMQFAYNGIGDRLKTIDSGAEKRYLLDINKPLTDVLADMDSTSQEEQYYLYGLNLLGRIDAASGDLYTYHPDHLGSIMAVTNNPAGTITAAFAYDEFGAVAGQTGGEVGPWRFCGDLGLQQVHSIVHFVRARFYADTAGRLLQRDPIRNIVSTQGVNAYPYVGNSPLMVVDPRGLYGVPAATQDFTSYAVKSAARGLISSHKYLTNAPNATLSSVPDIFLKSGARNIRSTVSGIAAETATNEILELIEGPLSPPPLSIQWTTTAAMTTAAIVGSIIGAPAAIPAVIGLVLSGMLQASDCGGEEYIDATGNVYYNGELRGKINGYDTNTVLNTGELINNYGTNSYVSYMGISYFTENFDK